MHHMHCSCAAAWLAEDLLRKGDAGAAAAPMKPAAPSVVALPRFSTHAPVGLADLGFAGLALAAGALR